MNFKIVLKNLGIVLICEALLMGISLLVAIIYEGSDIAAFIYTILITLAAGIIFTFIKPDDNKI